MEVGLGKEQRFNAGTSFSHFSLQSVRTTNYKLASIGVHMVIVIHNCRNTCLRNHFRHYTPCTFREYVGSPSQTSEVVWQSSSVCCRLPQLHHEHTSDQQCVFIYNKILTDIFFILHINCICKQTIKHACIFSRNFRPTTVRFAHLLQPPFSCKIQKMNKTETIKTTKSQQFTMFSLHA